MKENTKTKKINLFDALELMEKERGINIDNLLEDVCNALRKAYEQAYGASDNLAIEVDKEKREMHLYRRLEVVEEVEEGQSAFQMSLSDAMLIDTAAEVGDIIRTEIDPKSFSRIAVQTGKSIITQKIREEERQSVNNFFLSHLHTIMTGAVSRVLSNGMVQINFGKADAYLAPEDCIPGEVFNPNGRIKVYVVGMQDQVYRDNGKNKRNNENRAQRVRVSRVHPGFVRCLYESEVTEIKDGIVEIKSVSREPGIRSKIAVFSHDESVDPVGACIGLNGARINAIVSELSGEKIDVIRWNENPAEFVENALAPAKVIAVAADEDEKTALVVVPDDQLSLAIGIRGLNVKLAAKLTGYKIDIKSETQAKEQGLFDAYEEGSDALDEVENEAYAEDEGNEAYEEVPEENEAYTEDEGNEAYEEVPEEANEAYAEETVENEDGNENPENA